MTLPQVDGNHLSKFEIHQEDQAPKSSGAKTDLRSEAAKYYNAFATFKDPHTISLDNGKGKVEEASAKYILIACGGRPSYGDYPGVKECCISSDDIFWQKKAPGKTLFFWSLVLRTLLWSVPASSQRWDLT